MKFVLIYHANYSLSIYPLTVGNRSTELCVMAVERTLFIVSSKHTHAYCAVHGK